MAAPSPLGRNDTDESSLRLAVLIDADNAQAAVIEGLLAEVARFGEATVKRIYGDFTSPNSASWKKVLQKFAIKPVQQYAYTTGKNATDSTLIIEAMDLLYTRKFDGFCLVTSDSDFTSLAMRIREEGLTVFGFGEKKTPDAFRNACNKFIFTELLRVREQKPAAAPAENLVKPSGRKKAPPVPKSAPAPKIAPPPPAPRPATPLPTEFMLDALERSGDDSGWAYLGVFGNYLNKLQPDFDARNFGFRKLSDLVKAHSELFVTEERNPPGSNNKQLFVRAR
jgi:hypothetical protein